MRCSVRPTTAGFVRRSRSCRRPCCSITVLSGGRDGVVADGAVPLPSGGTSISIRRRRTGHVALFARTSSTSTSVREAGGACSLAGMFTSFDSTQAAGRPPSTRDAGSGSVDSWAGVRRAGLRMRLPTPVRFGASHFGVVLTRVETEFRRGWSTGCAPPTEPPRPTTARPRSGSRSSHPRSRVPSAQGGVLRQSPVEGWDRRPAAHQPRTVRGRFHRPLPRPRPRR